VDTYFLTYSPEAIHRSIDFGVRSIEHRNLINRATAKQVAAADAFVVRALVTYDAPHRFGRGLGLPEVSMAKIAEEHEAGLRSLEILQSAGVKIGYGADLLGGAAPT
jgi:imidazolonepropionase-like amidohydrolase